MDEENPPEAGGDTTSSSSLTPPVFKCGRFENPNWPTWKGLPGVFDLFKWKCERDNSNIPNDSKVLDEHLPIKTPDFVTTTPPSNCLRVTWIGHATVMVQMDGVNIITDPIWTQRSSPVSFMGPKRFRPPPCHIEELPKIDIALISHNHYDHLDKWTVKYLERQFGGEKGLQWFVPMGLAWWMRSVGCQRVLEMTWGQEVDLAAGPSATNMKLVFLPAQHWSTRNTFDKNSSLWGGWAVIGQNHRFFFAGDTGYTPEFKKIGRLYGPFDFAAIPIGCYCPRWFMGPQHVDPKDAVQIHRDVGSKRSLGIHWGTFNMGSTEFYLEPRISLIEEVEKAGLEAGSFRASDIGETWILD